MIRVIGIALSLLELVGFGCGAYAASRYPAWGWVTALLLFFSLSAYGFVLRLRERTVAQAIEDAEDKLVKRVLRRLAKALPDLIPKAKDIALHSDVVLLDAIRQAVALELESLVKLAKVGKHPTPCEGPFYLAGTLYDDVDAAHVDRCPTPMFWLAGVIFSPPWTTAIMGAPVAPGTRGVPTSKEGSGMTRYRASLMRYWNRSSASPKRSRKTVLRG